MASRNVAQVNAKGEEVAPVGNNKVKKIGVERKSRRALGDIGNQVIIREFDGKPLPQVSRPITRGFCAQLLANGQAAENKVAVAPPKKKVVARKPAKKVADKPKPEDIIELSPDSEVKVKEKHLSKEKASIAKSKTFSASLTARSKAACGLTSKPKEQVVDIDAADLGNDLAVVEYVEDMYKFYKSAENEGRVHDYMGSQPELNEKVRAILVDWLAQVHERLELAMETFYLTINIIDRYLAVKRTTRKEIQLVGIASLLLASKYEEIWAPEVDELVSIADGAYLHCQVRAMEKKILGELEWQLTVPTPYVFLVRFIKASITGSRVAEMVHFLAELGMMNYKMLIHCPSLVAASAVYAARCTLEVIPYWTETLKSHTGFSEDQLMDSAKLLVSLHRKAAAPDQDLRGIYKNIVPLNVALWRSCPRRSLFYPLWLPEVFTLIL